MSKRIHITELSDKVIFIEFENTPRSLAETMVTELEQEGFKVIYGGFSNE